MPRPVLRLAAVLPLLLLLAVPADAAKKKNQRNKPSSAQTAKKKQKKSGAKGPVAPRKALSKKQRKTVDKFKRAQKKWRRHRAKAFEAIAAGDFDGRHVLHRTDEVTAFLDWGDPQHPDFDPARPVGEWDLISKIPENQRAHVLVIPNQKREHLTKKLKDKIHGDDLDAAGSVIREAEALAVRLGIENAQIFINSSEAISVGYMHVHIIGERSKPYPEPIL